MPARGSVPESEIRALLKGELGARQSEDCWQRIRNDDGARRFYDRMASAEAALDTDEAGYLGTAGTDRVQQRLFNTLLREAPIRPRSRPLSAIIGWASLGATAMCAALIAVPLLPEEPADGFQQRSANPRKIDGDHTLQVLRVTTSPTGAIRVAAAQQVAPGDHLRFAVFTRHRPAQLSILAVRDGARTVLSRQAEIPVSPSAARLPLSFDVPSGWSGQVRFVAVFSHGADVDLTTIDLEPRDEEHISIRAVTTMITLPE